MEIKRASEKREGGLSPKRCKKKKAGIHSERPTPELQTSGEGKAQYLLDGVQVSEIGWRSKLQKENYIT